MTLLGQTLLLYLLIGVGVAGAVYLTDDASGQLERWFRVATALPFWPFYVPLLLTRGPALAEHSDAPTRPAGDDMAAAIAQVDAELEAALASLDGWAEDVLAREKDRIRELRSAWTLQAERIREMDRLLAQPAEGAFKEMLPTALAVQLSHSASDRLRHSQEVRRQNLERLARIRQRAYDDLMGTLAWVRELVSMIHLAKFTGASAARAEELVAQIAAAVEGLSEVADTQETYVITDDSA